MSSMLIFSHLNLYGTLKKMFAYFEKRRAPCRRAAVRRVRHARVQRTGAPVNARSSAGIAMEESQRQRHSIAAMR